MATVAYSLAVSPSGGPRTWTVLDSSYGIVLPVEDWLETHRHLWSPNTVRGYATALAQWWTFLEQRGEADRWRDVGVPAVAGFLSWLRNGRTVEHAVVAILFDSCGCEPAGPARQARIGEIPSTVFLPVHQTGNCSSWSTCCQR